MKFGVPPLGGMVRRSTLGVGCVAGALGIKNQEKSSLKAGLQTFLESYSTVSPTIARVRSSTRGGVA
jgi:hypothetical protein